MNKQNYLLIIMNTLHSSEMVNGQVNPINDVELIMQKKSVL